MKTLNRLLLNLISNDLDASKTFYTTLFDFEVDFDSDWFVHLKSKEHSFELGLISDTSDGLPPGAIAGSQGFYATLVVDDADVVFDDAKRVGAEVVSKPENTFYGQRRLVLRAPEGTLIDVSSPIPYFSPETLKE
ncbi:VOC family protein [Saccharospirillum salsuginis]|uniref:Glyoxalase n=1 Tax=Saccharospirillum salsuginis TaxID=418750 RepID=A0A918KDG0_9GAMM|nr:VOC family protein [Saccharospirillum salsuginis]GGX57952.1 glyoxalase [Saccharospirillum salsuginis]